MTTQRGGLEGGKGEFRKDSTSHSCLVDVPGTPHPFPTLPFPRKLSPRSHVQILPGGLVVLHFPPLPEGKSEVETSVSIPPPAPRVLKPPHALGHSHWERLKNTP